MDFSKTSSVDIVDTIPARMPSWAKRFLQSYAANGDVKAACKYAGVSREAHYKNLRGNPVYRAAVQQTEEEVAQMLEDLAVERVRDGVRQLVLFQGEPVIVDGERLYEVEYNTQLHLALLKRFKPEAYRERTEVSGTIDLVDRLTQARARLIALNRERNDPTSGTAG